VSSPTTSDQRTTPLRLGRLPVHDRDGHVVAHELDLADPPEPGTDAVALYLAGMVHVGLDRIADGCDVVVTVPAEVIRGGGLDHLPTDSLIIDLGPDTRVDPELEGIVHAAAASGVRFRVADPIAHPDLSLLADAACMVAVDIPSLPADARRDRCRSLARPGRAVVACGVDDHPTREHCLDAGFDLVSGTVLSVPQVVTGARLAPDRAAILRLVAVLNDPQASVDAIEEAVGASPSVSYRVLRYVNSARVGLRTHVDSVRRAVILVGPALLRQLAALLLVHESDDRPTEATRTALSRARMCAELGQALGDDRPAYHTTGLLSAVDLLCEVPLAEALEGLPLSAEVRAALLDHDGDLGRVLHVVRQYERCNWDDPVLASFDPVLLTDAYLSGLAWAAEILTGLDVLQEPTPA
jgi:c-di-GMP phosphodiesterase